MVKKTEETKKYDEADLKLCMEHRKKLGGYMSSPLEIENVECDDYRFCSRGCPLTEEKRINPPKKKTERLVKDLNGKELPIIAPTKVADFMENLGKEVYGQGGVAGDIILKPIKQKKQKEISAEIEDFLDLQARVIGRLAWRPEIWKALDNMGTSEILDRLLGKSTSETIPFQIGGRMDVKPSKETKKLFAKLEKQYAEEDEKTGKKPYDFTEHDIADCKDSLEAFRRKDLHEGFFPKKEGEKKKNGKKPD